MAIKKIYKQSTFIIIKELLQPKYKKGHSCETALLRVYNDIVTTIGKGNNNNNNNCLKSNIQCIEIRVQWTGAMLVLLDLSAAFDTIDHDNLFLYS